MRVARRQFLQLAGAAVVAPALLQHASALDYPTRPVRFIVGYTPGGAGDTVSRIIGQWLSDRLGQPVIIDNKPGAGSNISVQAALNAPPDGYTILFVASVQAINASLYDNLPFNFLRDSRQLRRSLILPL